MSTNSTTAIILAAGMGTRMKSDLPKVLHPLAGRPMINHVLAKLDDLGISKICTVISPSMENVADAVAPHPTAVQHEALGTAHAVQSAREALGDLSDDVLILFGADPLVSPETLGRMLERRRAADNPAVVVLGFTPDEAGAYGRLITNDSGELEAIVEARDATPAQLAVTLCNAGFMVIDGRKMWSLLERVDNDNVKGEYYLTHIVALARADGDVCAYVEGRPEELHGVDSRADLAVAEQYVQQDLRRKAMDNGVTLIDPETVYFSHDTVLGRDVVVEPNVFFSTGVVIGDNVTIRAFCHFENTRVGDNTAIGPFARMRSGTDIGDNVRVGNFVEFKNATMENGAKAAHLSYVGDATVGSKANIGAGTITCNYDGVNKHRTTIGDGAFIGSNTALVAPVSVGKGAMIGAGSTITKDVEGDTLAVTRADQKLIKGWPSTFFSRNKKKGS